MNYGLSMSPLVGKNMSGNGDLLAFGKWVTPLHVKIANMDRVQRLD